MEKWWKYPLMTLSISTRKLVIHFIVWDFDSISASSVYEDSQESIKGRINSELVDLDKKVDGYGLWDLL